MGCQNLQYGVSKNLQYGVSKPTIWGVKTYNMGCQKNLQYGVSKKSFNVKDWQLLKMYFVSKSCQENRIACKEKQPCKTVCPNKHGN